MAWPLDREFRATKIVFERARAHEKIAFMTPYVVEEVHNVRISRWRSSGLAMWIFSIGTYDPVTFLGIALLLGQGSRAAKFPQTQRAELLALPPPG